MEKETLDVVDMMGLLKISRSTLDKRTRESRGGLNDMPPPFTKKGQRPLWSAKKIREWIEDCQSGPAPSINVHSFQKTKKQNREFHQRQLEALRILDKHRSNRTNKKSETR